MTDDIHIPAEDQQSIDDLCATFRTRIENLYRRAYIQGRIDEAQEEVAKLKARVAA